MIQVKVLIKNGGNALLPEDALHIWLYAQERHYLLDHRDQGYGLGYPLESENDSTTGLLWTRLKYFLPDLDEDPQCLGLSSTSIASFVGEVVERFP